MHNTKLTEDDFNDQDEQTKQAVISAYIKTVEKIMESGFSYSYSCSVAAAQSLFQKKVIMYICKKELSMVKMRDDYKKMKSNQRKKFTQGIESAEAVRLFDEVENAK